MKPVLGVDFGRARIGLAISDELRLLAHPLETVATGAKAIPRIQEIVAERNVASVVIGIPKLLSGVAGAAANEAALFAEKLRRALPCEVLSWDERLTTVAAERALREAGKKTRATRGYIDQVAAQMILQGFLDRQRADELPTTA